MSQNKTCRRLSYDNQSESETKHKTQNKRFSFPKNKSSQYNTTTTTTYLKNSLVTTLIDEPNLFPKNTNTVVTILNTTPNPNTTPYPISIDRGGKPPKYESCPSYRRKGGVTSFFSSKKMSSETGDVAVVVVMDEEKDDMDDIDDMI